MILIMILALVMIAILVVVWLVFLTRQRKAPVVPATVSFNSQKVSIDWQTLKDPQIESLQSFKQIALFSGTVGRKNPFIPY